MSPMQLRCIEVTWSPWENVKWQLSFKQQQGFLLAKLFLGKEPQRIFFAMNLDPN